MTAPVLRSGLPELPVRMKLLPLDARGYPVPRFVQWFAEGKPSDFGVGQPDFRVTDGRYLGRAVRESLCWLCGHQMGTWKAYVIGPMCAINRVSGEPPCHRECAQFAARACPFLTKPKAGRREAGLDELDRQGKAGGVGGLVTSPTAIDRNPGVALVWITRDRLKFARHKPTPLFEVGEPYECLWFAEGRAATRAEVQASIDSGYPILLKAAEEEGPTAIHELECLRERAMPLLPAAAAT